MLTPAERRQLKAQLIKVRAPVLERKKETPS
jgi:hypothetical protein